MAKSFEADAPQPTEASIESIVRNPRQPRTTFDNDGIEELTRSIAQYGVLQPLVVRKKADGAYELIAGERRLRASRKAGLDKVPVIIREAGSQESLEIALIENLQRINIRPLERARAYKQLIEEFQMTQEQVAEKLSKSRVAIANTLRLLKLPEEIRNGLESERITEGHARALLAFESEAAMLHAYHAILSQGLSVRQVEELTKRAMEAKRQTVRQAPKLDPNLASLQEALSNHFQSKVRLSTKPGGRGSLQIEFTDAEELDRLLDLLGVHLP
ncbi:MAG: ParB/RepB/Spo0J family partition protein [Armatimonadetes bacterium]|nr:ParB/RepB/Spo0J family partition protein [Armatimonadota bacterium]